MNFMSRSKKLKTRKVKVVYEANVVSISCCDYDILLVSPLTIFGQTGEKALQGHITFLVILHQDVKRNIFMRVNVPFDETATTKE
jgi:hypothetical protein